MLLDFFIRKNECTHPKVPVEVDEAYCPDCGALVKNRWFIIRCSCCNIKRKGHIEYKKIIPDTHFCPNCGSSDFFIEELSEINFMDVNYAVFQKTVIEQKHNSTSQIWIEDECEEIAENNEEIRLIEVKEKY